MVPKDFKDSGVDALPNIEIDEATDEYLTFAARIAGLTKSQVVAQLVAQAKTSSDAQPPTSDRTVTIHADYEGHRTSGRFFVGPSRIEITDGPLAGESFRTPSEAARAVVSHYKPSVSPHRNGWAFWIITASGNPLQTIRHDGR